LRPKIGNWIFGCDVCQEVCPWNETGDASVDSQLVPYLPELMALDDDGFRALYGKSAIRRAKRRGLLRNVAVALGNSGNPDALASLEYAIENDKESLVRAHAAWAIGNIGGTRARETLANQLKRENETEVASEIKLALARL
jgi:epoxyqueuosine reductase